MLIVPSPSSSCPLSRRRFCAHLGAATAGALAGCAPLAELAGPQRITLGPAEIAKLLERQLPRERRVLEVFEVTLTAPQLRFSAERNRLGAVLDAAVRERVLGSRYTGRLDFDAALRWQASDRTLRLANARVASLQLGSGTSGPGTGDGGAATGRLGAVLAERVLEDLVIYALPAERAEALAARGLAPSAVAVTDRGVEITLAPIAS